MLLGNELTIEIAKQWRIWVFFRNSLSTGGLVLSKNGPYFTKISSQFENLGFFLGFLPKTNHAFRERFKY